MNSITDAILKLDIVKKTKEQFYQVDKNNGISRRLNYAIIKDEVVLNYSKYPEIVEKIRNNSKDYGIENSYLIRFKDQIILEKDVLSFEMDFINGMKALIEISKDESFYGALIKLQIDGKSLILNPFNPLNAVKIKTFFSDNPYIKDTQCKFFVYELKNIEKATRDQVNSEKEKLYDVLAPYSDEEEKYDLITEKENINVNVVSVRTSANEPFVAKYIRQNIKTSQEMNSLLSLVRGTQIEEGHRLIKKIEVKKENMMEGDIYLIVPHNLINDGVMYPYYGHSLIVKKSTNNSFYGGHLTPFLSPNIGIGNYDDRATMSEGYRSLCTGSVPSYKMEGWRTISHANLLSPYFKNTIKYIFWKAFQEASIEISNEIYEEGL
jgi:hypothetical protein